MNLVYFHYFIDYTAKSLVTLECSTNPFRTILPQMALENENLLGLLLAYAACHRARLLGYAEPVNRISTWVSNLFPTFRQALADKAPISDALFGTCVMLTSLTLSWPLAFGLPVSWQAHLSIAQRIFKLRVSQGNSTQTQAGIFFTRWFAYLDAFGSMSGYVYNGSYAEWSRILSAGEIDPSLRCLVGHTSTSLTFLGRVADLAKLCEFERGLTGRTSMETTLESQKLRVSLELATLEAQHKRYDCMCEKSRDSTNVYRAVNSALCHAALIVLQRRVYLLPPSAPLVQASVVAIMECTGWSEQHGFIDIPDVILPLFLAGCETTDKSRRAEVMHRLQRIGDAGMSQTARVRNLLYTCWNEGRDWTTMDHDVLLG